MKKGNSSWKPAARLDARVPSGYVGRWVDKDPANMAKKLAEGWLPATEVNGATGEHNRPNLVQDGKPLTSVTEYRESVLMLMPEETAQQRRAYFENVTAEQLRGLKRKAQADDARNADSVGARAKGVRGTIVIE